jgi:hypothetical protein
MNNCYGSPLLALRGLITFEVKSFLLEKLFNLALIDMQVKKDRLLPVWVVYFAVGSSHFGSQSPLLSSFSVRLVCMP